MSESAPTVATVAGEVPTGALGVVLPHEHLIHRISVHSGKDENTCLDVELVAEELRIFRQAGGGAICDVTPTDVGRDPLALLQVSRLSEVYIVSALGLYQLECWPAAMRAMSRQQLSDYLVKEAAGGGTGIAAGFIGEIASHNEDHSDWRRYRLWDEEAMVFAAVADTQRRTGLFVSTHASLGRPGMAQLQTIIEAGGDPQRVIIGHCDAQMHEDIELDLEYYHKLLDYGAWVEFDMFGWDECASNSKRFDRIGALVREGFADRLLLSTDTCRLSQLHRFGGRGFEYLFTTVLPGLQHTGLSEAQIDQMTVINPARMLTRLG